MQIRIRCYSCHTPYAVKPEEVHAALDEVMAQNLKYYNAPCPSCGKANKVSKKQLRQAAPNWTPPKKKKPKAKKTEPKKEEKES